MGGPENEARLSSEVHRAHPDPTMAALAVAMSGAIGFAAGAGLVGLVWWIS